MWATPVCQAASLIAAAIACVLNSAMAGAPAPIPEVAGADVQTAEIGSFTFGNGDIIDNLKVSYVTFGQLNATRDNAVLVMHAFTGDWRYAAALVGPGKALDPEKYFVVAIDFLGNSNLHEKLTTGPTNSGLKMHFPQYSVRDWVELEYRLLTEHLGIERIRAALGSSIGAMKAYQLAVSHPEFVSAIVPIAGEPETHPETRAILRIVMDSVRLDPDWRNGFYDTNPLANLQSSLMILLPWWATEEYFAREAATREQIIGYNRFWERFWSATFPQDARDVYYQLRAWEEFRLGDTSGFDGDTQAALASIKAKTLIVAIGRDRLTPPERMKQVHQVIPDSRYIEIDSWAGHLASVWFDPSATARIDAEIASFLDGVK